MTTSMKTPSGRPAAMAAGMLGCLCLTFAPAVQAGEWQTVIEVVKSATDEEILAELQRRQDARRAAQPAKPGPLDAARGVVQQPSGKSASKGGAVTTRNTPTGLSALEDSELLQALRLNSRAIYGTDDRRDWHQMTDQTVRRLASATVALFQASDLQSTASGNVKSRG